MASLLEQLTGGNAAALLAGAAERNFAFVLELKQGSVWVQHRSRFLGLQAGGQGIWIDLPASPVDDRPAELAPGQPFLAYFVFNQSCYRFASRATRTGTFDLLGGQRVHAVLIGWPGLVQRVERRSFYRVPMLASWPINVLLWDGNKGCRPADPKDARRLYRGRLANISIGGVLARFPESAAPRFITGQPVGLECSLEPGGPGVILDADIRRNSKLPNGLTELAIRFESLELSSDGRKMLTYLSQALARLERKTIRRSRLNLG